MFIFFVTSASAQRASPVTGDNVRNMKIKSSKFPYLPLLIAGIAVILFSSAGVARIAGWNPASASEDGEFLAPDKFPAVKARCVECGVIVSMREIEAHDAGSSLGTTRGAVAGSHDEAGVKSTKSYEIVVRLADRSSRVITEANPARWQPGQRVVIIGGASPSHQ